MFSFQMQMTLVSGQREALMPDCIYKRMLGDQGQQIGA